jgi:hypothetical protein
MTEVQIPFKSEFKKRMLSGHKTVTSRTRKYGEVGDTFQAFGATFRITLVFQYKLDCVAYLLCHEEGFDSPDEFIACWATIHPGRGYQPSQTVWVHRFKKEEKQA